MSEVCRSRTFEAFDTVNTLRLWDGPDEALEEAAALCAHYEALFSKFRPGSDVWRINHAGGATVTVAPETAAILAAAKGYHGKTGGSFDVTIGSVNRDWDFRLGRMPQAERLERDRKMVDSGRLVVTGRNVSLPAGWEVDLGGIAKGFIADAVAGLLRRRAVTRATIDLGGNLVLLGSRPGGGPWRVGVQRPGAPVGESCAAILAENASVVTSGVYERGFDWGGKRYHHILDPRTGCPAHSGLVSVTLVTQNATDGDAFTTACLCLGLEGAKKLAAALPGAWALLIAESGELQWFGPPERLLLGETGRGAE